jgi:CelD/BcsL family acetyltransferase involved in cellulose biosynthesis
LFEISANDRVDCHIVLRSLEAVKEHRQTWEKVWRSDPRATVFQSYAWAVAWLEHYQHFVKSPFIIICYAQGKAVGITPLYLRRFGVSGFSFTAAFFLGTGEPEDCESCAEYMTVVCEPGRATECFEASVSILFNEREIRGVILQRCIESDIDPLCNAMGSEWTERSRATLGSRYTMPVPSDQAYATLRGASRRSIRSKLRKLEALPGYRVVVAEDANSLILLYGWLCDLHNRLWAKRGKRGAFSNSVFREFHRDLALQLLERDELLLFALVVGDRPLAVSYCFFAKGVCHYYQSGIDIDLLPKLSPGLLSHFIALELCHEREVNTYDLMLGAANSSNYKGRIARPDELLVSLELFRSRWCRWKFRLLFFFHLHSRRLLSR